MNKALSPTTAAIVIGAAVLIAALVLIFGVFKPQIGPGPVVQPKPWRPKYAAPGGGAPGAPAGAPAKTFAGSN